MLFALLVLLGLIGVAAYICVASLNRSRSSEQESSADESEETYELESAWAAYLEQEAMDDMRRRRLHAEEQLRRLSHWRS